MKAEKWTTVGERSQHARSIEQALEGDLRMRQQAVDYKLERGWGLPLLQDELAACAKVMGDLAALRSTAGMSLRERVVNAHRNFRKTFKVDPEFFVVPTVRGTELAGFVSEANQMEALREGDIKLLGDKVFGIPILWADEASAEDPFAFVSGVIPEEAK